jgi:hypothetical protein
MTDPIEPRSDSDIYPETDIDGPGIVPKGDEVSYDLPVEDPETENDIVNDADDKPEDEDIPLMDATENSR